MKIGIVTFWQSQDNYGQILQCWALQQYLKKLGHEPFLIRYSLYGGFPLLSWTRKFVRSILLPSKTKRLQVAYYKKNKIRFFEEFKKEHVKQTKNIYTTLRTLRRKPPVADAYIVGSDQVWNPALLKKKRYYAFWLDFGSDQVKRIAYAASFGTDMCPLELREKLSRQLSRFNALSVREKSGIAICAAAGRQATHVLDPTLLLSMKEYCILSDENPKVKLPYIYVYSINISDREDIRWSELSSFSAEKGMSLIVTPSSGYIPGQELFGDVEYCYATIPQWISFIRHSELVVTTSFHGVVFCILLHKRFVYFPLSNINSKGNSRVLDLLSKLDLSDCIWKTVGDYKRIYDLPINWAKVENSLSYLRKRSYTFLKTALS